MNGLALFPRSKTFIENWLGQLSVLKLIPDKNTKFKKLRHLQITVDFFNIQIKMNFSFRSFLFKHFYFFLFLKLWNIASLQSLLNFLAESFDTTTEQKHVIITFFKHFFGVFYSSLLIEVIDNDNFSLLIFVLHQLCNPFISFDVWTWKIKSLPNMELFVFFWLSKVNQKKICVNPCWELLGFYRYRSQARHMTD